MIVNGSIQVTPTVGHAALIAISHRRRPAVARVAAILGVMGLVSVAPRPADACSCVNRFFGAGKFYLGEGGRLPADARGIPFEGSLLRKDGRGHLKLEREKRGHWVSVPFQIEPLGGHLVQIIPKGGLITGERYRVRAVSPLKKVIEDEFLGVDGTYPHGVDPVEVVAVVTRVDESIGPVMDPIKVTVQIGDVTAVSYAGASRGGSCQGVAEARTVDVKFSLPPALDDYADYLLYTTYVDGGPWAPRSAMCDMLHSGRNWLSWSAPPTADLLFGTCSSQGGLEIGSHRVWIEARTPAGEMVASSPSIDFTIDCTEPDPPPDAAISADPPAPDAVSHHDLSARQGPSESPPPVPAERSRGCAVILLPGEWPRSAPFALFAFLTLRARRRALPVRAESRRRERCP